MASHKHSHVKEQGTFAMIRSALAGNLLLTLLLVSLVPLLVLGVTVYHYASALHSGTGVGNAGHKSAIQDEPGAAVFFVAARAGANLFGRLDGRRSDV